MRLSESVTISAPAETVWHYLEDPENYLRFMSGITHWEVVGEVPNGLGARYRILVRIGAAEVGGLIEMVEWNEPFDIAWHSVTGVDHRGRWRIRDQGRGRTKIEFRFAYGVIGAATGLLATLASFAGLATQLAVIGAAPQVRRQMKRTMQQLKRQVEHEQRRADAERRRTGRRTATA
jgi:uncharacterized membrane protein